MGRPGSSNRRTSVPLYVCIARGLIYPFGIGDCSYVASLIGLTLRTICRLAQNSPGFEPWTLSLTSERSATAPPWTNHFNVANCSNVAN